MPSDLIRALDALVEYVRYDERQDPPIRVGADLEKLESLVADVYSELQQTGLSVPYVEIPGDWFSFGCVKLPAYHVRGEHGRGIAVDPAVGQWYLAMKQLRVAAERASQPQTIAKKSITSSGTKKIKLSNEVRDRWIYEQCMKGVAYGTIILKLKKKPKSWDRIESIQGIRYAATKYAERNDLPPIPRRQNL